MGNEDHQGPHLLGKTTPELLQPLNASSNHLKPARSLGKPGPVQTTNYFKSAEWSPDGTSLLTSSADDALRFFILPPDLLSEPHPKTLEPYTTHTHPEPIYATRFHPSYSLQEPSTCLSLVSLRALPTRLISPFAPGILSSYPLVSPTTEEYTTPHSLIFNPKEPHHFLAGSDSCISLFDINRNGEGPISRMRTTLSRRNHKSAAQGIKGIVSALGISEDGVLAAGTFTRWIGLYDDHGGGGTRSVFPLARPNDGEEAGKGVTQVLWSVCGRYLCVAERGSDGISVWDIRGTGTRLAWLKGRKAGTQQRLSVDVMGGEVWAGGTDGVVRVWEGLGMVEGRVEPSWEFKAHDDAVSSASLHPTGSVLATSSGQRHWVSEDSVDNDSAMETIPAKPILYRSPSNPSLSTNPPYNNRPPQGQDHSIKVWTM